MHRINLPERFKNKLDLDYKFDSIVKGTLDVFGQILIDNRLYFFPEYTDHGFQHIEKVLSQSDNLITENTCNKILTSTDIGCYILAVILHDLGMHINLDGLQCLLQGEYDNIRIDALDKNTWKQEWDDFLNEAKKYSGKQLKAIFGDENHIFLIPNLEDINSINEADKKLIGEFIRRNHARLAHEIALKGFPGKPNSLVFAPQLDLKTRNIIGLVARSHGLNLRPCTDYLEAIYGRNSRRLTQGVHAVYLMVVLRLADYIQIDRTRISESSLETRTFSSPVSKLEHELHNCINSIDDRYQDDPERIYVTANPLDSQIYIKLKKLISEIQYEFDISWAVLGELYGLQEKPEIRYRRITSNLTESHLLKELDYVPDEFFFKANDQITKLLIAPLYGSDPKYGIRELIQNAVDACREREMLLEGTNHNYIPEIEVRFKQDSNEPPFFLISDNGIGMDIDVIKNYFLSAGASYRKSLDWLKQFVNDEGDSKVIRSGRFGIGVLAAFLIGNEIKVETRKLGSSTGYKFNATLNTDQINVIKDETIPTGTRIKITVTKQLIKDLDPFDTTKNSNMKWFRWYILKYPSIKYHYNNAVMEAYKVYCPNLNATLPKSWNEVYHSDFKRIMWTYSGNPGDSRFICNGFIIPSIPSNNLDLGMIDYPPRISVFDPNGNLPLNLNRNGLSGKLPFAKALQIEIYKDYLAYLLTSKIAPIKEGSLLLSTEKLSYPGFRSAHDSSHDFIHGINAYNPKGFYSYFTSRRLGIILKNKNGFIIDYNYFIRKLNVVNAILIHSHDMSNKEINLDIKDLFYRFSSTKLNSIEDYKLLLEAKNYNDQSNTFIDENSVFNMKTNWYSYLFLEKKKRLSATLASYQKNIAQVNEWTSFEYNSPKFNIISTEFLQANPKLNFIRQYQIQCPFDGNEDLDSILHRYLGDDVVIPYNIEDRKRKFPLAFEELYHLMKNYI